jgi:hypothetical protein
VSLVSHVNSGRESQQIKRKFAVTRSRIDRRRIGVDVGKWSLVKVACGQVSILVQDMVNGRCTIVATRVTGRFVGEGEEWSTQRSPEVAKLFAGQAVQIQVHSV